MSPDISSVFVGRESIIEQLNQTFQNTLKGFGSVVLITGEEGIGKTTLIDQFNRQIVQPSNEKAKDLRDGKYVRFVSAQCIELTTVGNPYAPFMQILNELRGKQSFRRLAPKLFQDIPWIGAFLSEAVSLFLGGNRAESNTLSGNLTPENFSYYYLQILSSLAKSNPLVIFLDDLQWADQSSINLILSLSRRIEGHPILLIGAYRPVDIEATAFCEEHILKRAVLEMRRYKSVTILELQNFPDYTVTEYLAKNYPGVDRNREFTAWLYNYTKGWPFFMIETIQLLISDGDLQLTNGSWQIKAKFKSDFIPDSIESVIHKRIGNLTNDLRQVILYASILGARFQSSVLGEMLQENQLEILGSLRTLRSVYRMVEELPLVEFPSIQPDWQFSHSIFQKVTIGQLGHLERISLHSKCVDIFHRLYPDKLDIFASELAMHCEAARQYIKAASFRLIAAYRAALFQAYRECINNTEIGLQDIQYIHLEPIDKQVQIDILYLDIMARFELMEKRDLIVERAKLWVSLSIMSADIWKLASRINSIDRIMQRLAERSYIVTDLLTAHEQTWKRVMAEGSAVLMVRCLEMAYIDSHMDEIPKIVERLGITLRTARSQKDLISEAIVIECLAYINEKTNNDERSRELYLQALDTASKADHKKWREYSKLTPWFAMPDQFRGFCLEHIGNLYRRKGDFEKAINAYYEVVNIARNKGDPIQEAGLLNVIAYTRMESRQLEEAWKEAQIAISSAEKTDATYLLASVLSTAIEIARSMRDVDKMISPLEKLNQINLNAEIPWITPYYLERMGDLCRLHKDYLIAINYYNQVVQIGHNEQDAHREAGLLNVISCTLIEAGEIEDANQVIHSGLEIAKVSKDRNLLTLLLNTAIDIAGRHDNQEEIHRLTSERSRINSS